MPQPLMHKHLTNEYLLQINNLALRSKIILEGSLSGQHASPYHGYSSEFSQYRNYVLGDDLKNLDWKVLGRSEKWVSKQFKDETNTHVYTVLDSSESMNYSDTSGTGISKLNYAGILIGSLCYLAQRQRDAFGLITGGLSPEIIFNPRNSGGQLSRIYETLNNISGSGETAFESMYRKIAPLFKARSVIYIFTDLWSPTEEVIQGLKYLNPRSESIHLIYMTTPDETLFFKDRHLELKDMESKMSLQISSPQIQKLYRQNLYKHINQIKDFCYNSDIHFKTVSTEQAFFESMRKILNLSGKDVS